MNGFRKTIHEIVSQKTTELHLIKPLDLATNLYKRQRRDSMLNDITGDTKQNIDSGTSYRKTDLFFPANKL